MTSSDTKLYRAQEFAELAGITVRTLHHYDRLGVFKPSGRTQAGYRLYRECDLVGLERIVALKFIGFPLSQIKEILSRKSSDFLSELRLQREALTEKRRHLDLAVRAIQDAERVLEWQKEGGAPDWDALRKIIEVMEMHENTDWMKKYYSAEAWAKIEERKQLWSSELQEGVSRQWRGLIEEVRAAVGEDPAGEKAQALAQRWTKLVEGFTGGDPSIAEGLKKLYADKRSWPNAFAQQAESFAISEEVWNFIHQAISEGKKKH